jgi:stage V sporulation protein SpoVS
LSFPAFQAPGVDELLDFHRDMVEASGSQRRAFGKKTIKNAIAELKRRGFYGIRRASLGRLSRAADDSVSAMAFARSYGNEPHKHLVALAALTDDEVRKHDRAVKLACERYRLTGIWPGWGNVVSLDERRRAS